MGLGCFVRTCATKIGRGPSNWGRRSPVPSPKMKCRTTTRWYQNFPVIYPSTEIRHCNWLMAGALEFWKIQKMLGGVRWNWTRQAMYSPRNVTMRRFHATIVAVEKRWGLLLYNLSVCICSLRYLVFNAHAPYFRLWPVPFYNISSTFSHKDKIFEKKKLLNTKCVFWFPLQICLKYFSF